MTKYISSLLFISSILLSNQTIFANSNYSINSGNDMKITILYDNYSSNKDTKSEWGFSCLIEGKEKTILMDTGGDAQILKYNMEYLKIDPSIIDVIVITHEHWDHIGGLNSILDINNNVTVYLLPSFSKDFIRKVEQKGAEIIFADKPTEICKGVFTTGQMGSSIKEQSLVIEHSAGTIITTGCSHQGIVNILKKGKEIINDDIYIALGGYHLRRNEESETEEIVSEFIEQGVIKCGATHCTGDSQIEMFKTAYKENYVSMGSGKILTFSNTGLN